MINRRKFLADSAKVLLGASVGVVGTGYENQLAAGTKPEQQQNEILNQWWIEQPINPNGDFSAGEKYWKGGWVGRTDAKNVRAGMRIIENDHGEVWLDNPDPSAHANSALMQATDSLQRDAGIRLTSWSLSDHHLMLEADVRVDSDQPYSADSWSRVAIAFWLQRTYRSGPRSPWFTVNGNEYKVLFTEYDVYRRNVDFLGYNAVNWGGDVNEYPADQLPIGYWKPIKIDLNEFIANGYNSMGGWGQDTSEMAYLSAWYLVPEAKGAKLQASWRRVKIYNLDPLDAKATPVVLHRQSKE
jgi:hypothetical protein